MRPILVLPAVLAALGIGACAQVETDARPAPAARAFLEDSAPLQIEADSLNHLIRVSIDANRLYDQAADEADDADLQAQLRVVAAARKIFVTTTQTRVAAIGATPAETGETTGTIHRAFTMLRALVTNDSVAAATEVYRGETYMIDELEKALKRPLTAESKALLQAELTRVKTQRNQVELVKSRIETRLMNEAALEDSKQRAAKQPQLDPS